MLTRDTFLDLALLFFLRLLICESLLSSERGAKSSSFSSPSKSNESFASISFCAERDCLRVSLRVCSLSGEGGSWDI